MPEPRILVFGATSMVGSHFAEKTPGVSAVGRSDPGSTGVRVASYRPLDLTDLERVERIVAEGPEEHVVNFAAHTGVDRVETERPPAGKPPSGPAWELNALLPAAIARGCETTGKTFVHISTNFVFDGRQGPYDERATRSPLGPGLSWYGWTKSEGERLATEAAPSTAIIRLAFPYRTDFPRKLDFARWILERNRHGSLPPMYVDQQLTPSWIPDVTEAVRRLTEASASGTFHCASTESTTPYEFARELLAQVSPGGPAPAESRLTDSPTVPGKAVRPVRAGLVPAELTRRGLPLTSWREGIRQLVVTERGR